MEVRYSILAKLEPLCLFCRDKIRSLNMKDNGPLVSFTDCFQGLEITEKKSVGIMDLSTSSLFKWLNILNIRSSPVPEKLS